MDITWFLTAGFYLSARCEKITHQIVVPYMAGKEMGYFSRRDNCCHGIFFSHYVVISARIRFSMESDTLSEDIVYADKVDIFCYSFSFDILLLLNRTEFEGSFSILAIRGLQNYRN